MEHPGFYERAGPFRLSEILEVAGASSGEVADPGLEVRDIKTLDTAGDGHISFLDNPKYVSAFAESAASACFVAERYAGLAPPRMTPVVVSDPYQSFVHTLRLFYPDAILSMTVGIADWTPGQTIHASAELEEDVQVEPGAIVGPEANIGRGTVIAAGAVIGYRVHIGRDCYIGPSANVTNALIGDRVIIRSGAGIGRDGYGCALGRKGHLKVPQIGRVIIQDAVEIGANTTIDRGVLRDTIVGEGTKIDNLVQIGHNVVIGGHCLIVGQTGVSGSTELGDFVIMAGRSGALGHVKIGAGAHIGANACVTRDVPPGARWGGSIPARPMRQWGRELAALKKLAASPTDPNRKGHASDSSADRGRATGRWSQENE